MFSDRRLGLAPASALACGTRDLVPPDLIRENHSSAEPEHVFRNSLALTVSDSEACPPVDISGHEPFYPVFRSLIGNNASMDGELFSR